MCGQVKVVTRVESEEELLLLQVIGFTVDDLNL